jgi:NAD(P)H-flavin reductase
MGNGFPVEKVPPEEFNTMLIFATGTGISPIKALIDSGALNPTDREDVRLYYGATDADSMAYLSRCVLAAALGHMCNGTHADLHAVPLHCMYTDLPR